MEPTLTGFLAVGTVAQGRPLGVDRVQLRSEFATSSRHRQMCSKEMTLFESTREMGALDAEVEQREAGILHELDVAEGDAFPFDEVRAASGQAMQAMAAEPAGVGVDAVIRLAGAPECLVIADLRPPFELPLQPPHGARPAPGPARV